MPPSTAPAPGPARRVIPIAAQPADSPAAGEMVSLYAKQHKVYPRAVHGWFARWRWVLVWFTQLLFYGLPWLPWNSRPAVLFDLAARRFYIFDLVLYPQDFIYLTGLLVVCAYGLFLFTAVAGRLWCGYACPQTVYTEIFLWLERRIEGDRPARLKLDAAPWSWNKAWRKGLKQAAWITLALWTGFTFVGYFTPIRQLWAEAFTLGFGPWEWFWVLFYAFATYGNAGYMREQVCRYMCPYARFQSAMFDHDTLVISYDSQRGEPRGTRGRNTDLASAKLGHCIDCKLCVQVCPTGIDIRNGLQYDCIACTACIDVCNGVMDKMHYPRGLIRYATQNGMALGLSGRQMLARTLRPRVLVYSAVLLLITSGVLASLLMRSPFRVDVVRDRGSLARLVEDGAIENIYRLQLMNATEQAQQYRVVVEGIPGALATSRGELTVGPAESRWVPVAIQAPFEAVQRLGPGVHPLQFRIEQLDTASGAAGPTVQEKSTFVVPR